MFLFEKEKVTPRRLHPRVVALSFLVQPIKLGLSFSKYKMYKAAKQM